MPYKKLKFYVVRVGDRYIVAYSWLPGGSLDVELGDRSEAKVINTHVAAQRLAQHLGGVIERI